jgi:hypothetical protein
MEGLKCNLNSYGANLEDVLWTTKVPGNLIYIKFYAQPESLDFFCMIDFIQTLYKQFKNYAW